MPRVSKHLSLPKLKAKAWRLFSVYVRTRWADKDGYVKCVTCGVDKHWKELHAGHFFEKSTCNLPGYFSESGVHPQCPQCNLFKSGNKDQYALWLEKEYGHGIIQELDEERKKTVNEREFLESLIANLEENGGEA